MERDALQGSIPDSQGPLLYPLMVIATIAVVLVSLVGVATVTGIIPRLDTDQFPTSAIHLGASNNVSDGRAGSPRSKYMHPKPENELPRTSRAAADCTNCAMMRSAQDAHE